MKKIIIILMFLVGIFSSVCAQEVIPAQTGEVLSIEYIDDAQLNETQTKQKVTVKILSGEYKGDVITVDNMLTSNPAYDILLSKGDKVVLHFEPKTEFIDGLKDFDIFIADISRVHILYILTCVFFAILFVIGRRKGFLSFLSICATVGLIFAVLTPMILHGINPIFSTLTVCLLSTVITIYLVGGFNHKSTSAVVGTTLSLIIAAVLSTISIKIASLTGFTGEESMFLYSTRPDLDFTGILTSAMMIAALGAVMDVSVSIASTINEIHVTDLSLSVQQLFKSGMNVGKDIIGTMSNTLILVYLGSSLPLVLLSSNIDMTKFFNLNQVITEIVSAMIGSIAILLCVPITAIIGAYLIKLKTEE